MEAVIAYFEAILLQKFPGEATKSLIKTATLWAEIQTWDLPNTMT
jgi:hypothetical protein